MSGRTSVKKKKKEIKRKHGFARYDDDDVGVKSELENKEGRKIDVPDMVLGRLLYGCTVLVLVLYEYVLTYVPVRCHRGEPPSEISSVHRLLAGQAGSERCDAMRGVAMRLAWESGTRVKPSLRVGSAERQR